MSGSSSGPPSPRGSEQDCASLFEETVLNSPNPSVISRLKLGDVLDLQVHRTGKAVVLLALHGTETAGSITSTLMAKIIDCIGKGFEYVAIVKSIRGGACTVQIRPKGS